jgi:hypothetical protein
VFQAPRFWRVQTEIADEGQAPNVTQMLQCHRILRNANQCATKINVTPPLSNNLAIGTTSINECHTTEFEEAPLHAQPKSMNVSHGD